MDVEVNSTTLMVAIISALGAGGLGREIIVGIIRLARGVSLREGKRKEDIVAARMRETVRADEAEEAERAAKRERDAAERNTRRAQAYAARLELELIRAGLNERIPDPPVLEDTLPGLPPASEAPA